MDYRGMNRKLRFSDFGSGKIDQFTISDFGPNWQKIHAVVGYRINEFKREVPYKIKITSSHRTPGQNKAAGGSKNSKHLTGNALDLWIYDPGFFFIDRLKHYVKLARKIGFNGVGIYKGKKLLHVDVRPKPGSWGGIQKTVGGRKSTRFVSMAKAIKFFSLLPESTKFALKGGATIIPLVIIIYLIFRFRRTR